MHIIETDRTILEAEDGLILGNGDLSVSVYQRSEHLVWRFGKTDVWDRRVDLSDDFEPVHIDEIRRGIRDEGWVSDSYRGGEGRAAKGARDPKRMKEVCTVAPSYAERQVPCPKPVGELWMHLPIDKPNMKIHQRLTIERAELEITITWDNGGAISLLCFIHPRTNVLVVRYEQRFDDADGLRSEISDFLEVPIVGWPAAIKPPASSENDLSGRELDLIREHGRSAIELGYESVR